MNLTLFLVICSVLAVKGAPTSPEQLDSLGPVVFASLVYRHGDRNPISFIPDDPYQNNGYWPEGMGQLVNAGKKREYNLGKWIKSHYKYLISEEYNYEEIYVRSVDEDRCLMSAAANLAGMYPPKGDQRWEDIDWQPIPIHTIPQNIDRVLMHATCPKYDSLFNQTIKTGQAKKWHDKYKWVMDYVSKHAGETINDLVSLEYMYGELAIEDAKGFKLPQWLGKVYPEPLKTISNVAFSLPTITRPLQRLKAGPFFDELTTHFKEKRDGTMVPDRKLWIYSAHDITITNILNSLDMYNFQSPPYASLLMIEMRKPPAHDYTINFLLKNETNVPPYVLTVPKCGVACPLDKFIEITTPLIPNDWETECQLS